MNELIRRRLSMANNLPIQNYEIVGNPKIHNGILTTSADSWIQTPEIFNPGSSGWEIVFRIKRTNVQDYQNLLTALGIMLQARGADVKLYLKESGSSSYNISYGDILRVIPSGVEMYIKLSFDGNTYSFGTSVDGANFSNATLSSSAVISPGKIAFGAKANNTSAVSADYYLSDIYVKIDGFLWWTPYK